MVKSTGKMLPRYKRAQRYPDVWVGLAKHRILYAIHQLHYCTEEQVADLLGSRGALTTYRQHLSELYHSAHIARIFLHRHTGGSPKAIYTLDRKGRSYLRRQGIEPRKRGALKYGMWLEHTLQSHDLTLLFHRYARVKEGAKVLQYFSERECQYLGLRRIIPDGWVDLDVGNSRRMVFWLECDRGTLSREDITKKVEAFVDHERNGYYQTFGTKLLTVLFVAVEGGEKRAKQLKEWVEGALSAILYQDRGDLFRFASFSPAEADPITILEKPAWLKPYSDKLHRLTEGLD